MMNQGQLLLGIPHADHFRQKEDGDRNDQDRLPLIVKNETF